MINNSIVGNFYACVISEKLNITSKDLRKIDFVWGKHENEYTTSHSHVLGIHYSDGNMIQYFPIGFEKYFENIIVINFINGDLKEINENDLRPFPELKYCGLDNNNVETLENGIFDYNPKLEVISLLNNRIKTVGLYVFAGLDKLSYLFMASNQDQCTKDDAVNNKKQVAEVIKKINNKCKKKCIKSNQK